MGCQSQILYLTLLCFHPLLSSTGLPGFDSASSLHQAASDMVEMNPDTNAKSDRPEWCYVHYDKTYNPKKAFQLEFQWVASTPCLLYQLVSETSVHSTCTLVN